MPEIALTGCTPEPLMSYLKALGVFRLVAEQADACARLSWTGGIAHLHSRFDRESLVDFFLEPISVQRRSWVRGTAAAGSTAVGRNH